MALNLTENNQLYLYQLFSRKLGVGRQTFITRVEEVLSADDLSPLDMGAATTRELLEGLGSFIELKVFKGGRVYAIVRARDDWDATLARAGKTPPKPAKGKPWKRAKNALRPVKPKRSKERLEAERRAAEEAAEQERRAAARAQEKAARAAEEEAAEPAGQAETAAGASAAEGAKAAAAAGTEAAAATRDAPSEALDAAPAAGGDAAAAANAAAQVAAEAEPVLFSPAGAQGATAEVPAEQKDPAEKAPQPAAAHGGISLTITYDPGEGAQAAGSAANTRADKEPASDGPGAGRGAEPQPEKTPVRRDGAVHGAPGGASQTPTANDAAPEVRDAVGAPVSPNVAEPALFMPHPRDAAPSAEAARARTAGGGARTDYPVTISNDVYCRNAPLSMLTRILPYGIDLMAVLDEDWRVARATGTAQGTRNRVTFPLRYLQEDGSAPVEVTLKRSQRPGTGARWELALVDGDDGTGAGHEAASLEGLPQADEGAWSDLDATATAGVLESPYSPLRAFAQQMSIGSWDALLGELARTALPEHWSAQAKPQGPARYNILREYLAVTYAWVSRRGLMEQSADGSFAAFNTGLSDSAYEDLCLCVEATGSDIPWRFIGFATAGNGALGRRIVSELPRVPQAPRYVTSLEDIVPDPSALLVMDYRTLLGPCLGRLPRAFLTEMLDGEAGAEELLAQMFHRETPPADRRSALEQLSHRIDGAAALRRRMCRALDDAAAAAVRRCQRSYRTAAPVYDPRADRMKLLLPLCLVDDRTVDCALVLERQPSGAYQAASLLALPRAYACARVVCADMPAWLAPSRALG